MKAEVRIAVVGATGLVGREVLTVLGDRQLPLAELRLYSSLRTAGEFLECGHLTQRVDPLDGASFEDLDIVILAASEEVSAREASRAVDAGATVIDMSQIFADDYEVPLVVPEVNAADLSGYDVRGIVTSPDPIAIAVAVVLNPLREAAGLRRIVATSMEPVSGAGRAGIEELRQQAIDLLSGRETEESCFPRRVAFNLIPQVGEFLAGGAARDEQRSVDAIRRLLDYPELPTSVTRVRVPLFFGQAIALNLETQEALSADAVRDILRGAPGILVRDEIVEGEYPTPADVVSEDATWVGRIRSDELAGTTDIWIASDNLRKGAAVNAVQIAEILARDYL